MPITKTINFLPAIFQSQPNQKFLNATMDQLVTEPNLIPINGYVGRKFAPGFTGNSTYVREPSKLRTDYQLEPSVIVKDPITGDAELHVTYPEILQKINYYGGNIANPNPAWSNEYYSYNPHINLDAFIDFNQYYWLPNGPDPVEVFANSVDVEKTYYVYPDAAAGEYKFSGFGVVENPDIVLARGGSYQFTVNQPGKPFWIQSDPGLSGKQITNNNRSSRQVFGVQNNGIDVGTVTFNVPSKTAQDLFTSMPIVQTVDLVASMKYSDLQGQLLSTIVSNFGGIDGQRSNLANKYLIFGTYYADDSAWTAPTTVPTSQRYGVWQISLTAYGTDFILSLNYVTAIPINNKVLVQSGIDYGNTEWYTDVNSKLAEIPVITASLDTLYYQDGVVAGQVGVIKLVEVNGNVIDIPTEVLGKKNYVSPNGVIFTNGLKVRFDTSVSPTRYQNNEYYVDGVGTGIRLTPVSALIVNPAQSRANFDPTQGFTALAAATLNATQDQITITSSDVPSSGNIAVGTFPNANNSNYIVSQELTFSWPYRGGQNSQGTHTSITYRVGTVGVSLVGIPFYAPSNGCTVPGSNGSTWTYDSTQANINGADAYGGFPDADGVYHYQDSSFITANAWANVSTFASGYTNADGHSKLIGYAEDGYPIYGPYGYANAATSSSGVVRMRSSYEATAGGTNRPQSRTVTVSGNVVAGNIITVSSTFGINPGMRVMTNSAGITPSSRWVINNGSRTATGIPEFAGTVTQIQLNDVVTVSDGDSLTFEFLPGAFIEDYTYLANSGTLDQYNGRFGVTPEFPNGTYAYFVTQDSANNPVYPYVVGRSFYGSTNIDTNTSLTTPDYIVINRASRDLNPWSRRNRWFHKGVINVTALYNNTVPVFDQEYRAKRPIIEFDPDFQLYDFGRNGLAPVDLFDTTITQPFLGVEGASGIYIDGVSVVNGMRIIFSADQDPVTRNKIWIVNFVDVVGVSPNDPKVIHLTPADDGNVVEGDTVSVFNGISNNGKSFWYDGVSWNEGQTKSTQNQPPLFDVIDPAGVSFGNQSKYPISNNGAAFQGTKIFSYKEGEGAADPILGFPLTYKNFNNIGDIQFENNYDTDSFLYTIDKIDYISKVNEGFLYKNLNDGTQIKLNVWNKVVEDSRQYQNISYVYDGLTNSFLVDIVPNNDTSTPNLLVFVNYRQLLRTDYAIVDGPNNNKLIEVRPSIIFQGDRIDILVYSDQVSKIGFFETPYNLNFNAQNQITSSPTLGEMRNHIGQLVENSLIFSGTYPGISNLRDISVTSQGGTILQQSAPTTFATMFLSSTEMNFVDSVTGAQQEYTRFKNRFITIATQSNQIDYSDPVSAVDSILQQINQVKNKTFPWYYSDMVPYGANKNVITYKVFDPAQRNYEITSIFSNDTLSNKAVLIYLNGDQLLYGRDYAFLTTGPGVRLLPTVTLEIDDEIAIVEYRDTDGNWIPETPTKLGLYPKFTPEIYVDDTYLTPQTMIRGHDGSLTPAFGDFRDDLLLELEKRIYNNVKVAYDNRLVDIYSSKPGKFRDNGYSIAEFNNLVSKGYLPWVGYNRLNYVNNTSFSAEVSFTFNYSTSLDVVDGERLPGSWRACYEYFYDTQRPHTNPWEMLGFSEKPDWWESTYGPAPYTAGNKILWDDLEAGYISSGPRQGYDERFKRPGLSDFIPVNDNGELLPPLGLLTTRYDRTSFNSSWNVGQWSPIETAWRNSSEYPFAVQMVTAMTHPAKYFSFGVTTSKYRYDDDLGQYLVKDTNYRLTQGDIDVNGRIDNGNIVRASGYLNWISDHQTAQGITNKDALLHYVRDYTVQLSYRMAGFTDKQYLKVLAEQNSPNSVNESIIIPDSDFDVVLNKSSPVSRPKYSAVIVEKTQDGFRISGYDSAAPYFLAIPPAAGGASRPVRVVDRTIDFPTEFTDFKVSVPYGSDITSLQQMANFLAGYERYLISQGFRFDYFDQDLGQMRNWELSVKEFLFWVQQGWSTGSVMVLSPVADQIKFVVSNAVVDEVTNTVYGSKILTQNFNVLDSDAYSVMRDNNLFRISLGNTNGNLIGLLDINLVQYEHVLIFNNITQFNDIIYEPTLGARQFRLKLVGSKTGGWTGSTSPQGFMYSNPTVQPWASNTDYLLGDLVEYKNFYYSAITNLPGTTEFEFANWLPVSKGNIKSGLIRNFATNAQLGEQFYNTDVVNLENRFDLYGLALIGFKNRKYLDDLGVDDVSQVKFYQGFIKEKGTMNAIDALTNIDFNNQKSELDIKEEWAFRVGTYGSLETNQFVELVLDESYTLNNPTSLEVASNNSVIYSSLYTNPTGVYKSAKLPWNPPFLLNRTDDSSYSDDIQTAGFVNLDDVDYTIFDLTDISTLNSDVSSIGVGAKVWTAKDYDQTWNVFRVTETNANVIRLSNALNGKLLMDTDVFHNLAIGDTVSIPSIEEYSGFYRIESIPSLTSFTIAFSGSLSGFSTRTFNSPMYKMVSVKLDRTSDISLVDLPDGWRPGDKAWITDAGNGEWAVYDKSEPWGDAASLPKGTFANNGNFGTSLRLSADNKFALVGEPGFNSNVGSITNYAISFSGELAENAVISSLAANTVGLGTSLDNGDAIVVSGAPDSNGGTGYVFVYSRSFLGTISQLQILAPNTVSGINFGQSVAVSSDDQWLYVGAPGGDAVYVYAYDRNVANVVATITADGFSNSFALSFTPSSPEVLSVVSSIKDFVPYVDFTLSGSTINFAAIPPAGSIVVRQSPGFQYHTTLTYANLGSKFGYSVTTSTDGAQVVIGAPLANVSSSTNAGTVSVYDRSIEKFVASAGQTLFGGIRAISAINKVYIDDILQTAYSIVAGTYVQFLTPVTAGSVVSIETDQFNLIKVLPAVTPVAKEQLGYSVALCSYNCSIFAGAPYRSKDTDYYVGHAYRYLNQGRVYGTITGTVQNPTVTSGSSIRLNDFEVTFSDPSLDSAVLAINNQNIPGVHAANVSGYLKIDCDSTINANKLRVLPGEGTALSSLGLDVFKQVEVIENPTSKPYDYFGQRVRINNNSDILVVGSQDSTTLERTTIDKASVLTTFDAGSTQFYDTINSGSVWTFAYLGDNRNSINHPGNFGFIQQLTPYTITLPNQVLTQNVKFGSDIDVTGYQLLVSAKGDSSYAYNGGKAYLFKDFANLKGWDPVRSQEPKVDIGCIIKNYIYNAKNQTILYNLDYIDPAKGKILGMAEQDITYKTDYDPAVYNSTTIADVVTNANFTWSDQQVGEVWWDLSTVRYLDYEQGTIKYRTTNWGRTFPGSSIDVYEWVESIYPPSKYVARGGNGVPKYEDDSAYVMLSYVDPATNVATVKYYFWVKDKTTVTVNQFGRTVPTSTIANYIRDPKNSGIKYLTFLRDDSVSVYNVVGDTTGQDVILHVDYATQINSNVIHSEYALLPESDVGADAIPKNIYNKLLDSASGLNIFGSVVPDPTLPAQSRYGIDIRPRQSMFVDRNKAIKEMVTYVNSVFSKNLISQGFNLSTLSAAEPPPPSDSGYYDTIVPSIEVLSYIDIIVKPVGYTVLVENDSTVSGLWTIYTKLANNTWFLSRVQSYRTSDYWKFIDWYAPGFDSTVRPTYTVNTVADIASLDIRSQDIIKVLNNGRGKWLLVQVFTNVVNTVGLQDGTIELTENLYKLEQYGMGFGSGNFDAQRFDQNPGIEIRKILEALRNDIFVGNLRDDFIKLFFVFVYYVLDEQKYIDWAFKTSFIDVIQKVVGLDQPQIYNKDNQDYYRQYIEEVKPYHTTIREYVVDYLKSDNYNSYVTDFDVPAYFDPVLRVYRSPSGEFTEDARALQQPQYQDWLFTYPYSVGSIIVEAGGSGYTVAPQVTITGSTIGDNATARALVTNGVVVKIEIIKSGSNYITQPVITITGGNGTGARAYARLVNNTTRKIKTTLVYDRVTYGSSVLEWAPNTSYNAGEIITYGNVAYIADRNFVSSSAFVGNDLSVYPAYKFATANDRIKSYYAPEVGLPGKSFELVQEGIDYPGVVVEGPLFSDSGGFGVEPFDSIAFDPLSIDADGTYVISDAILDTKITSSYTDTGLGIRPEDIIVDGGEYVDTYSSHAPEELLPGRVFDTLDMTVTTFSTNAASIEYTLWYQFEDFEVYEILMANAGSGYSSGNVNVTISGTSGFNALTDDALITFNANGGIVSIPMSSYGVGYSTIPNVTITSTNSLGSGATATVLMRPKPNPVTGLRYSTFSYRIFKDMTDVYQYARLWTGDSTTLQTNLEITDTTIRVVDSSKLYSPSPKVPHPGVIFVNGERITYWVNDTTNNTLREIRRSTSGTGAAMHLAGSTVVDASVREVVPNSDNYTWTPSVNTTNTTTSGNSYTFLAGTEYIRGNLWNAKGVSTATDGNGLFAANTIQTIFMIGS